MTSGSKMHASATRSLAAATPVVLVVGAGVVGLSTALRVLETSVGPVDVVVVGAAVLPHGTLSSNTAALWEPFMVEPVDRVAVWARDALAAFAELPGVQRSGSGFVPGEPQRKAAAAAASAATSRMECDDDDNVEEDAGVRYLTGYNLYLDADAEVDVPQWMKLVAHEVVRPSPFPGHDSCLRFEVPMIETPIFFPFLRRRVERLGGRIVELPRAATCLTDAVALAVAATGDERVGVPTVIVNCSGMGARELVDDVRCFAVRGQIVRVVPAVPVPNHLAVVVGDIGYVLPRADCVILGGTAEEGEEDTTVNAATRARILRDCDKLIPGLGSARIVADFVGLRPSRRGGIRLELDVACPGAPPGVPVVHNYGHAGAGVTLSLGCAVEAAQHVAVTIAATKHPGGRGAPAPPHASL